MKRAGSAMMWILGLGFVSAAHATDACSPVAISTKANVSVSDGTSYKTATHYHSASSSAFEQIDDDGSSLIVVEGPVAWARSGDKIVRGSEFHKLFAFGHQYHAFILYFDEIMANVEEVESFAFRGETFRARSGDYPYGGKAHMVMGDGILPRGFQFDFPEIPPITVVLSNWKKKRGVDLPYALLIDDGTRQFDYKYTDVKIKSRLPLWFYDEIASPGFDDVEIYRVHRKLLAAHCLGDADMIADLSLEETIVASRGEVLFAPREQTRERFIGLFDALNYTAYTDLITPQIEVAESGDIGWITVQVRAEGNVVGSERTFDDQWAWVMMIKKQDGEWRHAGNASNRKEKSK
ncbi:MAG: hypothetical protein HKN14_11540 [Marinicaulis sp.]|nr:hypothetical protein [Marinicaulis sp.]NNL87872.1 hypothetical protein [Marinicaulis sp.]